MTDEICSHELKLKGLHRVLCRAEPDLVSSCEFSRKLDGCVYCCKQKSFKRVR